MFSAYPRLLLAIAFFAVPWIARADDSMPALPERPEARDQRPAGIKRPHPHREKYAKNVFVADKEYSTQHRDTVASGSPDSADHARIHELDRMTVLGRRTSSYTSSTKTLVAADYAGLHRDLGSVLTSVSGIDVLRTGGLGAYSTLSIRGSSASQVQVYLDGLPLNTAGSAAVDIGKIPLQNLRRITVYKSAAPLELTGMNAGGVVELTTQPDDGDIMTAAAEGGSYGYLKGGALVSRRIGAVNHRLSIDAAHSNNDFPYVWDITPLQSGDEEKKRMDNQQFTSLCASYAALADLPHGRLNGQIGATSAENGIFYYGTPDSNDGFIRDRTLDLHLKYNADISDRINLDAGLSGRQKAGLFQRQAPFSIGNARKRASATPLASGMLVVNCRMNQWLSIKGLAEGLYESYSEDELWDDSSLRLYSRRLTARGGLEINGAYDDLLAARAKSVLRYERDSTNGVAFVPGDYGVHPSTVSSIHPSFDAEALCKLPARLSLSGAARYSSRSPSFSERFGHTEHTSGKPGLKAERRLEFETGISSEHGLFSATITGFYSKTFDKIVFINRSQLMFVPENISEVRGAGVECDLNARFWDHFSISNQMTYMRTAISSDSIPSWNGNDEPLLPRLKDRAEVRFMIGNFTIGHSALFSSGYFIGPDNIDFTSPLPELGAYVSYIASGHWTFTYRIDNYLTEEAVYDPGTYQGTPLPGRMHALSVGYSL